jgi:hypothetical protein
MIRNFIVNSFLRKLINFDLLNMYSFVGCSVVDDAQRWMTVKNESDKMWKEAMVVEFKIA